MINRAILIGRLTDNITIRKTNTGKSTCGFTLAVQRNIKKQDGTYDADFIQCVAWNQSAEYLSQYASKGAQIGVDGRIQTRNYDAQDGHKVYVTEVICEQVNILSGRKENGNQNQYSQQAQQTEPQYGFDTGPSMEISSDDLPF